MDAQVLKVVGAVAGIGGIALALFFWLFRDIVRKNIFPKLTTDQAYKTIRLLMILATIVALAGIASWAFAGPRETVGGSERVLTMQVTKIGFETLAPAEILQSTEIAGGRGQSISDAALDEASAQITTWMTELKALSPHESVTVTVTPSGHPTKPPTIDVWPMVNWNAYTVYTHPSGKMVREFATSRGNPGHPWQAPEVPWDLQIQLDGHRAISVPSTTTDATTHTSPRTPVGVALDDLAGSAEPLAPRLAQRLGRDSRFHLVSPTSLAEARELVLRRRSAHADGGTHNSLEQIDLRARFGFEYVVELTVRVK